MDSSDMKNILFIQSGDYRDAYLRFQQGGPETFRDQKRSVDYVAALAPKARVTTVALGSSSEPRSELASNLWAGVLKRDAISKADIADLFDQAAPTHVVLRTPHLGILNAARRSGAHILPCFADIFGRGGPSGRGGPRTLWSNLRMRHALMRCKAPCFANHSLNASRSMVKVLGLPEDRVVPWDWSKIPVTALVKSAVADKARPTAFFAGSLMEEKGVGDCLAAVAALNREGIALQMRFAGGGDLDHWRGRAADLDLGEQVTFLGMIPNSEVRAQMHQHDFVVVPSRHSYPEGLPNTIYEGLASRSVLILSDHPAFRGRLKDKEEALVFTAANPGSLAGCFHAAISNDSLYKRLSVCSKAAHDSLYAGMEWTELVDSFITDPDNSGGWVDGHCLARPKSSEIA